MNKDTAGGANGRAWLHGWFYSCTIYLTLESQALRYVAAGARSSGAEGSAVGRSPKVHGGTSSRIAPFLAFDGYLYHSATSPVEVHFCMLRMLADYAKK